MEGADGIPVTGSSPPPYNLIILYSHHANITDINSRAYIWADYKKIRKR